MSNEFKLILLLILITLRSFTLARPQIYVLEDDEIAKSHGVNDLDYDDDEDYGGDQWNNQNRGQWSDRHNDHPEEDNDHNADKNCKLDGDDDHVENTDYSFHYDKYGDHHQHYQKKDENKVKGRYVLIDPDGLKRTVKYTSDKKYDYQATVLREQMKPKRYTTIHSPYSNKDNHNHYRSLYNLSVDYGHRSVPYLGRQHGRTLYDLY